MRIGIYGGAYNPPHIGHICGAEYACRTLNLDKLLLIPSFVSPHKDQPEFTATAQQRLEMLQIAAEGKNMDISDMELQRGGVSYTYQTIEELHKQYPKEELILVMGTDMFLSFLTWKEPERILRYAALAVLYRGDPDESAKVQQQAEKLKALGAAVHLIQNPVVAISSTQLRRMLVFECAKPFLPAGVEDYIRKNALYGIDRQYKNLTETDLEAVVTGLLKPNRVQHVLGCRDTAKRLAVRWRADVQKAARAGLLHDITKALDGPLQLTLCREYGIVLDEFSTENTKTLHALTGSLVAERIFGESPEVVAAIASHTTGKADMTVLEKIIYVADYMEPNRSFPGVEALRNAAYRNLDEALELGLRMTLDLLKEQGRTISPQSQQALQFLMENHKRKEDAMKC